MRGSNDLARVESFTKSGIGGGEGGARIMRVSDRERKKMRMDHSVVDFVAVMASSLDLKKLMSATKGSRCCTSAWTPKRMSEMVSNQNAGARVEARYNYEGSQQHQAQVSQSDVAGVLAQANALSLVSLCLQVVVCLLRW